MGTWLRGLALLFMMGFLLRPRFWSLLAYVGLILTLLVLYHGIRTTASRAKAVAVENRQVVEHLCLSIRRVDLVITAQRDTATQALRGNRSESTTLPRSFEMFLLAQREVWDEGHDLLFNDEACRRLE